MTGGKKTPALMLQGTGSGVGKSLLTAGFCRLFARRGLRVAPFKAQNMSLNSYVTPAGEEISRPLVFQAQAARCDLDIRMGPVLLKPTADAKSQCMVMGKPTGHIGSGEFMLPRRELRTIIHDAYDSISAEYDLMVLEGAGSPGEINLKKTDLVNMSMARHAQAKVLLAGDIDRGGLFASYIGHFTVMEPWERDLLCGFLINKFRGDRSLLDDALEEMKERTGRSVVGVLPYLHNLSMPEEDGYIYDKNISVDAKLRRTIDSHKTHITIAVIRLPYISNFTDFDAFYFEDDCRVLYATQPDELKKADVVILPGSKNVTHDMKWLLEQGFAQTIHALTAGGDTEVVGICGGLQMLGQSIKEDGVTTSGLGLLPLQTDYEESKELSQIRAVHIPSGQPIHGYRIHHGRTKENGISLRPLFTAVQPAASESNSSTGYCASPRLWATYLHGLFDNDSFRNWWLNRIRTKKNMPPQEITVYDLEPQLDRLADCLEEHASIETISGWLWPQRKLFTVGNPKADSSP